MTHETGESPSPSPARIRDRLANERTLLAWIRTALTMMGFGLVVAKFSWLAVAAGVEMSREGDITWVGVALVALGSATALVGAARTHAYDRSIGDRLDEPASRVLSGTAGLVAMLGAALTFYLMS